MVHCLVLLAAEDALRGILKPMPLPAIRCPNAPMESEPEKEFHLRWRRGLPYLPDAQEGRYAEEELSVGRRSRIDVVRSPAPYEAVTHERPKLNGLEFLPKVQVLIQHWRSVSSRDVAHPSVLEDGVLHRSLEETFAHGPKQVRGESLDLSSRQPRIYLEVS